MNTRPLRILATAIATAAAIATTTSVAFAAPPGGGAPTKSDRDILIEKGYTCARAGIDSHICTKKGAPSQVCDNAGTCTVYWIGRPGSPATAGVGVTPPIKPTLKG